jgi:hypothetical protein
MARSFDTIRAAIVEEYMRSYMVSKNCDAVVMLKQPSGQVVYRGKLCTYWNCFSLVIFTLLSYNMLLFF